MDNPVISAPLSLHRRLSHGVIGLCIIASPALSRAQVSAEDDLLGVYLPVIIQIAKQRQTAPPAPAVTEAQKRKPVQVIPPGPAPTAPPDTRNSVWLNQ